MNKDAERHYLHRFLEKFDGAPVCDVCDHESPDFLCTAGGVATGIEMVRYFAPTTERPSLQEIEALKRQLQNDLRLRSQGLGLRGGHYSVFGVTEEFLASREKRRRFADALLAYVGSLSIGDDRIEFEYYDLPKELQAFGIEGIMIYPYKKQIFNWAFPKAYVIPPTSADYIQEIIDRKQGKIQQYRKHAASIWLLIVAGVEGVASSLSLEDDSVNDRFEYSFDRVFIYDSWSGLIHELRSA